MKFEFCTCQEKENLFCTELVKCGVDYKKATKVARILTSGRAEETWTEAEAQLVEEACQAWLAQRKRIDHINSILASSLSVTKAQS